MRLVAIFNALGIILVALGVIMLTPISVALLAGEHASILPFVVACAVSAGLGLLFQWRGGFSRDFDELKRSEGMLIVTLAWLVTGAVGGIPYLFYGLGPIDAYFESISGFTTTGATILKDFSPYPHTFFFWRSLSLGWAAWALSCCLSPSCPSLRWPGGKCSLPRPQDPPRKRSLRASPTRPRPYG